MVGVPETPYTVQESWASSESSLRSFLCLVTQQLGSSGACFKRLRGELLLLGEPQVSKVKLYPSYWGTEGIIFHDYDVTMDFMMHHHYDIIIHDYDIPMDIMIHY